VQHVGEKKQENTTYCAFAKRQRVTNMAEIFLISASQADEIRHSRQCKADQNKRINVADEEGIDG
jgi:hypothetical protein